MAKRLPKGWHRGTPKKNGVYKTSREACVKDGAVFGNGYAERKGGIWYSYKGWGNHFKMPDFIWAVGSPNV